MSNTKTASLEELRKRHDRGETKPDRDDAKSLDLPNDFWDKAEVCPPQNKKSVHLRVDPEVLDFFKSEGKGHLTRMNAVLKSYVEARKKGHTPS